MLEILVRLSFVVILNSEIFKEELPSSKCLIVLLSFVFVLCNVTCSFSKSEILCLRTPKESR
jgi:hypothetical protein